MARKAPVVVSMQVVRNHAVCKKCNITLCEKNEMLYKRSYKGVEYFLNMGVCISCYGRPSKACRYQYEDPVLEKLSILQHQKIDKGIYHHKNIEAQRERLRNLAAKQRVNIDDKYVIQCLLLIKDFNLTRKTITPEMIETKRKQLRVYRELKTQGICVR
jgi:hypothetical protein